MSKCGHGLTATLPPSGDTPTELAEHLASGARLVEAFHLMPGVARAMREAAALLRELAAKAMEPTTCIGNDPSCPCQDGDLCHYKDSPDGKTKAWAAPEPVAWMIVEPGCEYGPTFGTENAAWSALTKAPPGSELVELIRRKA